MRPPPRSHPAFGYEVRPPTKRHAPEAFCARRNVKHSSSSSPRGRERARKTKFSRRSGHSGGDNIAPPAASDGSLSSIAWVPTTEGSILAGARATKLAFGLGKVPVEGNQPSRLEGGPRYTASAPVINTIAAPRSILGKILILLTSIVSTRGAILFSGESIFKVR